VFCFGCNVPVVLRRVGENGLFEFIVECYLDGFMAGEALESVEEFVDEESLRSASNVS
jgi:hypothetical protein